ncbi:MAG: helix-turn-helix transcriptional regulator [Actinomycetales bacterium]|nr:helix-turn-helix transcriptional regulator [Actinomycetales bacterium]
MQTAEQTWAWFNAKLAEIGFDSLTQFALAYGFHKSTLSRYFHQERQIPSGQIGPLCEALKVSPQELLQAVGAIHW